MKTRPEQRVKYGRSSIILLAVSAAIFIAALVFIYSGENFKADPNTFSAYGELVEFEKATVTDILSEDLRIDEDADGAYTGSQELKVRVKSGRYRGEDMVIHNYFGPLSGVPVDVGSSVTITVKTVKDGTHTATVYEYNRIPVLFVYVILFFIVILLVGRLTGLKSLAGLVFTVVCLFAVLIPLLIKGFPTVLTTFLTCAFIALVSFTILGGVHRKTISAFLGTVSGMFFAMIFALIVQFFAKIDGLRLEDAEPLLQLKYTGARIGLKGLLTASIIISALGAVMDVAMSISSALEEIHAANPALKRGDLVRSGMNIGRDMAGTMTNTLILAFLGSEFTLIIFLYSRGLTFYHLFSTAFVALETISGLSASIGMVLAIPLTVGIGAALITRKKPRRQPARR